MSDTVRAAIEAAGSHLKEHPEEARYTDSVATATLGEGLSVRVSGSSGEVLQTDMPSGVGGAGTSPSPGWLFRASIAACVASLAGMRAAQLGLEDFRCEVDVDSESDDRGILGLDPSVAAGPISVRVGLRLSARGVSNADLDALAAWAVVHCPVSDAVARLVPVRMEVAIE